VTFDVETPVTVTPVGVAPTLAITETATDSPAGSARRTRPSVGLWLAVAWLVVVILAAVFAELLPLADPLRADPRATAVGPSSEHWFGTDTVGRDLLARVVFGARATLVIAFVSIALAAVAGSVLGFCAGYFRGRTDAGIVMMMDAVLAFPTLVLALALTAFLGASTRNVVIAITIVATPVFGRLVRAQTLSISQRDFVTVARSTGASDGRILFTEIAPNVLPSILAYCLALSALAIVVEGSLSFLGIGVPPPTPTWGSTIASGRRELARASHIVLIPTAIMFISVLALNVLGDKLRIRYESPDARR
jgi:peptide/nickel transport system permease protein